jgi:protein gp37
MADNSAIEWTDATVNFWWGCTKVGPGCDHCYAETWDKRTGGAHWGLGVPRRKIASAIKLIHRLDNNYADWAADVICMVGNAKAFRLPVPNLATTRRVFIQSMSDLFDLEVPLEWFREAWTAIKICNRLDIQIVTKRISAVEKRLAEIGETTWPKHAGLIVTVVNQDEADRDVPRLLNLKAKLGIPWVGLSCEPLLGLIDLTIVRAQYWARGQCMNALTGTSNPSLTGMAPTTKLDWVIVGGESGPNARPMHPAWARSLRDQCAAASVPFLFKQWGEYGPCEIQPVGTARLSVVASDGRHLTHNAVSGAPDDRNAEIIGKFGKKAAGRLLDGVEHNGFPARATP